MAFGMLRALFGTPEKTTPRAAASAPSESSFVAFITAVEQAHFLTADQNFESDLASMRLRVGLPARELAKRVPVCLVPLDHVRYDPALTSLGDVSAIVVGKCPVSFFTQQRERANALVEWIESAATRYRVVVDFSDDLAAAGAMFSEPALVDFQKRLLGACHATVPTTALKERLMPCARHGISVIEDPYESERAGEPRLAPGAVLRLAWFGVFAAPLRPFVEAELAAIARRLTDKPTELAFVTHASQAALVAAMANALREANPQFSVRHVPWSVQATAEALAGADIAVLPQDAESDWGRVKSHNRLVETIRAGRYAVASPIPAYLELADYAGVGADLAAEIEWALANRDPAVQRIVEGQSYVAQRFAPARIADEWARVLEL